MSKRASIRRALEDAQRRRDYVRVLRRVNPDEELDGYVQAVGRYWVLIAIVPEGSPDGWTVVDLDDVIGLVRRSSNRFMRRSLQTQGHWPPPRPADRLELSGTVKQLIRSAAKAYPLVTVNVEWDDPGVCFIGRPHRWSRRLVWRDLKPDARWAKKPHRRIDPLDITRIDVGGIYETNLARVAGLLER